ncbi:MAG: alpha/beta hydrolase [Sandaracinaceae bacterium]|nr:alpha/beta hydrolase [Sandaracinaceae bacterium]
MKASSFEITAPDGQPIHVQRWEPEGGPSAVVQIAHGMAEHAGRYAPLAAIFAERGWAVYASDHRGHGRSIPAGEGPGTWERAASRRPSRCSTRSGGASRRSTRACRASSSGSPWARSSCSG